MANLVKKLSEMALEEAGGACHYAKMAVELKNSNQALSDTLIKLSADELNHMALLRTEAAKELEKCRKENPESISAIEAVHEYINGQLTDKATEARVYQAQYKGV